MKIVIEIDETGNVIWKGKSENLSKIESVGLLDCLKNEIMKTMKLGTTDEYETA